MENWIESEMAAQSMGDVRLNKRMVKLTESLCRKPSLSILCANTAWAETFAAYRFFDNEKVTFDPIMSGHREYLSACPAFALALDKLCIRLTGR